MTTKNGQLNDGREVYLNGNYVSNLASEAVFSRTLKLSKDIMTYSMKIKIIPFLKAISSPQLCFLYQNQQRT